MIENETQYRATKAQAGKFERSVQEAKASQGNNLHPLLQKAQIDAMKSLLRDLQCDLEAYDVSRAAL